MGCRGLILHDTGDRDVFKDASIYVHWDGSPLDIVSYLKYCELQGFRDFEEDESYAFARLTQVICNTNRSGLSVGVNTEHKNPKAHWDNGDYFIKGWSVVKRRLYYETAEDPMDEISKLELADIIDRLIFIDESQPVHMKIGSVMIRYKMSDLSK